MSIMQTIYTTLNVAAVNNLADDVSPYVRRRGSDFPCVLYEVPNQTFERTSSGTYRIVSEVTVACIARSVADAETLGAAAFGVLVDNECNVIDSVQREYEEGYDDDSVGLFIHTINLTQYGGA